MTDVSLAWAEFVSFWANWLLVGALVVGVVATYGIVVSGHSKEKHWESDRVASRERIALLESEAAAAKLALERAYADIAAANEKTAALENETARITEGNLKLAAELEREKAARIRLEQKIRPRGIDDAQKDIMTELLASAQRGPVYVVADWVDPEAKAFGKQVQEFLREAGFEMRELIGPEKIISFDILGAFLVIRDKSRPPAHLKPLYAAFTKAGFEVDIYAETYVPDTDSVLIGISAK